MRLLEKTENLKNVRVIENLSVEISLFFLKKKIRRPKYLFIMELKNFQKEKKNILGVYISFYILRSKLFFVE